MSARRYEEACLSSKTGGLQIFGFVAAFLALAGMHLIPVTETLSLPARNTLGVLAAIIVLLVTEALPLGIVCLTAIPMLYFFHCTESVPAALTGFTNATLFFVLASFGISEALTVVPVSRRLLLVLMKRFGQNTDRLLLAVMLVTGLLSSVISNVAAAAVFIPIVLQFLEVYDREEDRRRTGCAYMVALPVASMIGGMMTPAGSSINMLAISMLEKHTGQTISFVEWMLMGIPLAMVLLPAAWRICVRTFRPAPLSGEKIRAYIDGAIRELPDRVTFKEKYVIAVLFIMLALWILSSWIPVLQITAVAMIGLALLCLPGPMNVLTWKAFKSCVSLEAFLLMGVMISVGNVITATGLNECISRLIFPGSFPGSTVLGLLFVCSLTFLLLIPIPVAPALVAMLSAPLIAFCGRAGLSPVLACAAFGLCAGNCYLLPLDTVPLMTYSTGFYRMFDMPRATLRIQVLMILLCSAWLGLIGRLIF